MRDLGPMKIRPASREYGDYHRLWHHITADLDNFLSCCKRNILPPNFDTMQEFTDAALHHIRFNNAFSDSYHGRRFNVMRNGYIGIVPMGT